MDMHAADLILFPALCTIVTEPSEVASQVHTMEFRFAKFQGCSGGEGANEMLILTDIMHGQVTITDPKLRSPKQPPSSYQLVL
ncbi:hypothetical protein FA15DRAFT_438930 [Coprinopsis marcescibilis]|uniref:Uncharacterized protein n=1 Tax=Coprinopsis marcescibilis TaxID=230819 RepID=A0A5C3L6R8_COPMA|nr:hypothetical protein FA15DRAFT_438930 [Coprinopsis marcescibilis]